MPNVPRKETAKQRQARIHRNRRIVVFAALVLVVGIVLVVGYTFFFPVKTLEFTGTTRYSTDRLENVLALGDKAQLPKLDTQELAQKLLDELPYLESVEIERAWSRRTLTVSADDAKTVLAIKNKDSYTILSGRGKVIEQLKKKPSGSTIFTVTTPSSAVIGENIVFDEDIAQNTWTRQVFAALIEAYENIDYRDKITEINMKNPYNPTMRYQDRLTLSLGARDKFAAQLDFAKRTIDFLDKEDKEKRRKPSRGTIRLDVDGESFFAAENTTKR
ncbi:MAG: FtsQ-type POTRA domain-containing protein [Oscillospiraceae bacterium]|nr:FtsQ-type POTRA domain-containing protein [Oscillospiraceae bacterium]